MGDHNPMVLVGDKDIGKYRQLGDQSLQYRQAENALIEAYIFL
jgi:hypothetical protein